MGLLDVTSGLARVGTSYQRASKQRKAEKMNNKLKEAQLQNTQASADINELKLNELQKQATRSQGQYEMDQFNRAWEISEVDGTYDAPNRVLEQYPKLKEYLGIERFDKTDLTNDRNLQAYHDEYTELVSQYPAGLVDIEGPSEPVLDIRSIVPRDSEGESKDASGQLAPLLKEGGRQRLSIQEKSLFFDGQIEKKFWQDNPEMAMRFATVTKGGSVDNIDINHLKANTGYYSYISQKAVKAEADKYNLLVNKTKYMNALARGNTIESDKALADELGMTVLEMKAKKFQDRIAGNSVEKSILLDKKADAIAGGDLPAYIDRPISDMSKGERVENLKLVNRYKRDLPDKVLVRDKAATSMVKLRQLTVLGEAMAAGIKADSTGVMDTLKKNIDAWTVDFFLNEKQAREVKGIAAYNKFSGTLMNILYGGAVTTGEMARFEKQLSSLNKKLPIIMTQMLTQFEALRSDVEGYGTGVDQIIKHNELTPTADMLDLLITNLRLGIKGITIKPTPAGEAPSKQVIGTKAKPASAPPLSTDSGGVPSSLFGSGG